MTLNLEREIDAPVHSVFGAIKEGVLFQLCGALTNSMKIDFNVGGKYYLNFGKGGEVDGSFTEIVNDKKIAFTWGTDTFVTISLEPKGESTFLRLTHDLIPNDDFLSDVKEGWTDGLDDFGDIQL